MSDKLQANKEAWIWKVKGRERERARDVIEEQLLTLGCSSDTFLNMNNQWIEFAKEATIAVAVLFRENCGRHISHILLTIQGAVGEKQWWRRPV